MSRRLGERLIADGLLTPGQVDEALQNQLLSGGTIGTSLLDLGYIEEEALGETLASLLRVSYVNHERLKGIPVHVIAQLPGSLAEKHHAIPIDFSDRTLHVAAVHPKLLGSLSRLTGFKIVTWLAPEVRIYEALETYYGVPMRPRYVRIIKDLEARRESNARKLREMVAATISTKAVLGPSVEPSRIDVPEEFGYGRNWRAIAAELDEVEASGGEEAREERRGSDTPPRPVIEFRRVRDVLERFCDANYKEELFEATLGYLSQKMETSIVFGVRNQLAHTWDWRSKKLPRTEVEKLRLPVGGGSIFSLLLGRTFYRGAPEQDDAAHPFYSMLKVDPPAEVLLLPVYVNDRLVAVVYADNGKEPIVEDTANYRLLAEKLSAAFSLLILKMKIRA
jgi:hypothetical protein